MWFAINVYPINIDFVFVVTFNREVDFLTSLLNDINSLIVLHIKLLLNTRLVWGNMLGRFFWHGLYLCFFPYWHVPIESNNDSIGAGSCFLYILNPNMYSSKSIIWVTFTIFNLLNIQSVCAVLPTFDMDLIHFFVLWIVCLVYFLMTCSPMPVLHNLDDYVYVHNI